MKMVCEHSDEQLMGNNNNNQQSIMNMATGTTTITSSSPPNLAKAEQLKCPRCDSSNTKFCYYNNYSLSQPRHFCKACKRYWTRGGTLRNVPVGGGCRKNKRAKKQNVHAIKLSNPNPIRSSLASPNVHLNQLPTSSSADLSSLLLYGDVNLSSFSTTVNPQSSALGVGGLINNTNLTFLNNNDYSSFGSQLKQPKIEQYNQPMFPYEDLQLTNADFGDQNNLVGNINNSEIWQANYPFETLNVSSDSSYLNWNSAIGSVYGWHDATNSSIAPLI